jgi:hypothetical protein
MERVMASPWPVPLPTSLVVNVDGGQEPRDSDAEVRMR